MRKFLSKYILEVIPSIVATVVGAYIVTHYINAKPDADKPKAAVVSPADAAKNASSSVAKQAEKPGTDKSGPDKSDKADRLETTVAPGELRRQSPVREKAAAKATPAPAADIKETTAKPDDTRDANEIARAAIERLRSAEPRKAETPRAETNQETRQDRARMNTVVYAPTVVQQPSVQQAPTPPAPHAVTVAPAGDAPGAVSPAPFPVPVSGPSTARAEDPSRPTPPAEIPSRPLELRAKERTSVTEDVVSTAKDVVSSAKSVFQSVIPGTN